MQLSGYRSAPLRSSVAQLDLEHVNIKVHPKLNQIQNGYGLGFMDRV